MFIKRVQIEEGFLDGLDVTLLPGLNVIIGARGTGKTSLIELIKFCLDVKGHTPETNRRSFDHALSVLGAGQVTVTISDGNRTIVVSRTAKDLSPRATESFIAPLVFSQTEIESVGLQASGRLGLLSGFSDMKINPVAERDATAEARSLTAQATSIRREIEELQRRVAEIPAIEAELAKLAPAEQQLSMLSAEAGKRKLELDELTTHISKNSVAETIVARLKQNMTSWKAVITAAANDSPREEKWPEDSGNNPLTPIQARFFNVRKSLTQALDELAKAENELAAIAASQNTARLTSEERARQLRKELDSLQAGAGSIARQSQQLREKMAQLSALKAFLLQRTKDLTLITEKRGAALDRLDELREARFTARAQIAGHLTKILAPRINVSISRAGQFEPFSAAISDALKGSGLRYGDLAPAIAASVSPRELLESAENDAVEFIADATGISRDRTARLLAYLRETDLGALGTASVEDLVDFKLLDGTDYKDISELSTGQRCTVILPIVLRHTERMLIVDQPEDHIDNAFIADTLIQAVLARDPNGQIIFTSHNANIPVLGNANHIVQLGSDGKRGFTLAAASLETPSVVQAITSVMEGGLQAFEKRRSFYSRHKTT